MTTYQQGESPKLEASVTATATGAAADPSSYVIYIIDSAGTTKVDGTTFARSAEGEFYYEYDIPADGPAGQWLWSIKATGAGGRVTIVKSSFEVNSAT